MYSQINGQNTICLDERQIDGRIDRQKERQLEIKKGRWIEEQIDRLKDRQIEKQIESYMFRWK